MIDHLNVGGVQEFILNYTRCLDHQVTVFALFRGDFYVDRLRSAGAEVVQVTNSSYGHASILDPRNFLKFRKLLLPRLGDFDVIQIRLFAAFLYFSLLRLYKDNRIYASIDATPRQIPWYILGIYRHYARRYRWFLLSSMYIEDYRFLQLRDDRRLSRAYFVTVSKSVDAHALPSTYNFLSIGRCIKQKGHEDAIRFFQALRPHLDQSSSLSIIGDGPMLDNLKKSAGSDPDVHFLGSVPGIGPYLQSCTAILKFAVAEGENSVVREAALAGRPVVSTRETANCDTLSRKGFIIPVARSYTVDDVRRIARALMTFGDAESVALCETAKQIWGDEAVTAAWSAYPT